MFSKGDRASTTPIYPLWKCQHKFAVIRDICIYMYSTISTMISRALPLLRFLEVAHNMILWRHITCECECEYALCTLTKTFSVHSSEHWVKSKNKLCVFVWIFYVFVLSCVCYVFVRVCLYVLCGHLLGKG